MVKIGRRTHRLYDDLLSCQEAVPESSDGLSDPGGEDIGEVVEDARLKAGRQIVDASGECSKASKAKVVDVVDRIEDEAPHQMIRDVKDEIVGTNQQTE